MKFYYFLFGILLMFNLHAQEKFTLSGYIKDAANGEGLIGVGIYVQEAKVGTQTNAYGFYSITLPSGTYNVSVTYIGYQKQVQKISLSNADLTKNFELKEDSQVLQEVVVSTKKEDDNVKSLEMSVNKIDIRTIQKMPALLGEVDIIKSIQFLPGVTTVGEGASGFNVRGGNVDQNLVLLDEAPVYNSSHLFGFFSVFNPDAVKDVKLYKGGIPAQYGGRVSSILDVRMKEGNSKKLEVNGGIGTIFSRLAIEAPIVKDKGSFIIAGRRSYIDVLAKPFLKGDLKDSKFYYYDLTAKANYRINEKNNVYLSGYFGRDVFGADFGFNWGNATTTFRWNHVFNNKLFLNTTVFYSNYDYSLGTQIRDPDAKDSFNWSSEIINYSVKPDFSYYLTPKNTITFGGQATYYVFQPGLAIAKSAGEARTFGAPSKYAAEYAMYVANEQKISDKLSLQYGLRYSYYQYLGKADAYTLDKPNTTGDRRNVLKITPYGDNEVIQDYGNFEPRFSLNLGLGTNSSLKFSYNRTAQYLHLLSNTTASSPLDVWTPSSNNIKPQIADQVALGYFYNFKDNDYESSVEVYYKDMQNQIDYVRGADLLLNPAVEADLIFGKGRAYGSEFYLKKNKGKFNGWISYTLARTERQMDGLNRNEWFPARVDKTHNVAVVAIYDLNKRWSFSGNFTFFTGTPASFPTNKYIIQGVAVPHDFYDERNIYRISNYHRLDLAATVKPKRKLFKKGQGEYVFSIYNTYNRRNAFSEYVRQNPNDPSKTEAIRYSVFGSIIPAVTYNFKF
jgi:hypothetical protein